MASDHGHPQFIELEQFHSTAHIFYPAATASRVNGTRAHWAKLVPQAGSETEGTVIHVVGTPFTGYGLEFKRSYDISETRRKNHPMPLGLVREEQIQDVFAKHPNEVNVTPRDALEAEAKKIDPPTASPEPLNPRVVSENWPNTANPHLFLNNRARGVKTGPVNIFSG